MEFNDGVPLDMMKTDEVSYIVFDEEEQTRDVDDFNLCVIVCCAKRRSRHRRFAERGQQLPRGSECQWSSFTTHTNSKKHFGRRPYHYHVVSPKINSLPPRLLRYKQLGKRAKRKNKRRAQRKETSAKRSVEFGLGRCICTF